MLPRVGERDQSAHAIAFGQRDIAHQRKRAQHRQAEPDQLRAAKPEHPHGNCTQQHGRAKIRLQQQQHEHGTDNTHRFEHGPEGVLQRIPIARHVTRQPSNQNQLDHFDNLKSDRADVDPALCTIDATTNSRHQHGDQQQSSND